MKNQLAVRLIPIVFILCSVTGAVRTPGSVRSNEDLWWPHSDAAMDNFHLLLNLTQQSEASQQDYGRNSSLQRAIQTNMDAAQSLLVRVECLLAETANKINNATVEIGNIEKRVNLQQVTLDGLNRQRTEMDNRGKSLEISIVRFQQFLRDARGLLTNATLERIKDAISQAESQFDELRGKIARLELQFNSVNDQIETARQVLNETQSLLQQKRDSLQTLQLEQSQTSDMVKVLQEFLIILSEYRKNVDVLGIESRITLFVPRLIYSMVSLRISGAQPVATLLAGAIADVPGPCSQLS